MAKKWNEVKAVNMLRKNGITVGTKVINPGKSCGIKCWGAIDFLCNHCGFSVSNR